MTQDKHSPLPWKTTNGYYGPIIDCPDGQERVCTVDGARSPDEKEANAAFIVRACNNHYQLVEALKYARRFLKPEDVDMAYIDQALSNAKGGNNVS